MAKLFLVLATVCILQLTSAKVAPVTPDPLAPTFTELAKQADDALGALHSKFLEFVGVKSDNDLVKLVQTQGKSYAEKLQELSKQLSIETKSNAGKADEVFKTLQTRLTGTVEELRSINPSLFAQGEKIQQQFQENLRSVLKDTQKFSSTLKEEGKEISTSLEHLLKQIFDSTVQTAQKVTSEVETAIKQKKH